MNSEDTRRSDSISGFAEYIASFLGARKQREESALEARRGLYQNLSKDGSYNLSFFIRNIYSIPQFVTLPVVTLISVYLVAFYEKIGASLPMVSLFIALGRSIDVIVDPLMSYWTDSFRSRFGRRKPFCFMGCFIYATMLNLLLSPPSELSSVGASIWFGLCYVCFFLSNTFMTIPYDALGPELTDSYEDRSLLFFTAGMYEAIGVLVAVVLPGVIGGAINLSGIPCDNSPCFNDFGVGKSCKALPASGIINSYPLFNLTDWWYEANAREVPRAISSIGNNETLACRAFMNSKFFGDSASKLLTLTPREAFIPDRCSSFNMKIAVVPDCLANYCNCLDECSSICLVDSYRKAFTYVGIFFGILIVAAMIMLATQIKERMQIRGDLAALNKRPLPLVAALLNTFRNRPFVTLLPAWMLDGIVFTMVSSMMAFFVRYVIQPEYQTKDDHGIDCNNGYPISGQDSDSWKCKSDLVLGAIVCCVLLGALFACPLWLLCANYFGKRYAWMMWSLTHSIVMLFFLGVQKGDIDLALIFGVIAGMPLGARFLSDSILADVIDYDEFLTGYRNEATYTMFKSFIPKICAIPASAIPLSLLWSIGLKQTIGGHIEQQPPRVKPFCIVFTIVIPSILSLLSFFAKLNFPMRTKDQVNRVSAGIGLHMQGETAEDPISKLSYRLLTIPEADQEKADNFGVFPSLVTALELKSCWRLKRPEVYAKTILAMTRDELAICLLVFTGSVVGVAMSAPLLSDRAYSIIPVFCIIVLGLSIIFGIFFFYRLLAALKLQKIENLPSGELLDTIIRIREIGKRMDLCSRLNFFQELRIFFLLEEDDRDIDDDLDIDDEVLKTIDKVYTKNARRKTADCSSSDSDEEQDLKAKLKIASGSFDKKDPLPPESGLRRRVLSADSDMGSSTYKAKTSAWDVELYNFVVSQNALNEANAVYDAVSDPDEDEITYYTRETNGSDNDNDDMDDDLDDGIFDLDYNDEGGGDADEAERKRLLAERRLLLARKAREREDREASDEDDEDEEEEGDGEGEGEGGRERGERGREEEGGRGNNEEPLDDDYIFNTNWSDSDNANKRKTLERLSVKNNSSNDKSANNSNQRKSLINSESRARESSDGRDDQDDRDEEAELGKNGPKKVSLRRQPTPPRKQRADSD